MATATYQVVFRKKRPNRVNGYKKPKKPIKKPTGGY